MIFFYPPFDFPLDISKLLSASILGCHSVMVTKEGRAFALGYNEDCRIIETLPKEIFQSQREIEIKDKSGNPSKSISAVCGWNFTLYQVSTKSSDYQLVYSHSKNSGDPLFLNINVHYPIHLFSGHYTAAVIDEE